jgi:hypothetical protein
MLKSVVRAGPSGTLPGDGNVGISPSQGRGRMAGGLCRAVSSWRELVLDCHRSHENVCASTGRSGT